MKFLTRWCILGLFLIALGALPLRAGTPGISFTAVTGGSTVILTNPVTYTFTLTNNNVSAYSLYNVLVTNAFSTNVEYYDSSTNQGTQYYGYNTNQIIFAFGNLLNPTNNVQFWLTVLPQTLGVLTNTVSVTVSGTNVLTTNLVLTVINAPADLSVTNTGFTPLAYVNGTNPPAYLNDLVTCGVTVSNAGPGSIGSAVLTNTLPSGLTLVSVSPATSYTVVSNNALFSLGTLNSGSSQTFRLTFQPTNTGYYVLGNAIGAPGLSDPNTFNNFATTTLSVSNYLSTNLLAFTNSAQKYNSQNGLIEQSILVTNAGAATVPAVRLVVTGLTTNWLYNAVDTNMFNGTNGSAFVVSPAALAPGQSVFLLLQFAVTNRTPFNFTNGQLHPYGVALPYLTPPAAGTATNANTQVRLTNSINNGRVLLQFKSLVGTNYTVVYANNPAFANAMTAQPAVIKAQANVTQWIDYGPPETADNPTNVVMRFYRVILAP